jgi:hypothetical protein
MVSCGNGSHPLFFPVIHGAPFSSSMRVQDRNRHSFLADRQPDHQGHGEKQVPDLRFLFPRNGSAGLDNRENA